MKVRYAKNIKILCSNNRFSRLSKRASVLEGLNLITGITALILLGLIVYPFLLLAAHSLGFNSLAPTLSLDAYRRAFIDSQTMSSLGNTIYLASVVTILASLLGGGLAWLLSRTDLPGKRGVQVIIFLTFIMPSYIMAVSWIELLGHNGYINRIFCDGLHILSRHIELYSLEGVIFIMTIHLYPLVFMALFNALNSTDQSLEKAAALCGASRLKIALTVTFPLIFPSILSIAFLVFNRTMACFGVAAIIALPAGKQILTTRIYTALNSLDLSLATAVSIILVFISVLVYLLQSFLTNKKRFTVVGTDSSVPEQISLGKWKFPVNVLTWSFFLLTTIMPLFTIVSSSFLKKWGLNLCLKNLSLINYQLILFEEPLAMRAFCNSISFGAIAATIAVVLGSMVSYIAYRSKIKGRYLLEFTASWPMAVPGTVLAVAATLAWIHPPLKLYNTPWIIIVTYIAASLPFVLRNINGLMQGFDPVLEQAARISGASRLRSFKDINLPLILPGIRTGWILAFLLALREIPISTMLYNRGTETIGVLLFNLRSDSGGLELSSAIAVIVIILTLIGHLIIKKIGKTRMEVFESDNSRIARLK